MIYEYLSYATSDLIGFSLIEAELYFIKVDSQNFANLLLQICCNGIFYRSLVSGSNDFVKSPNKTILFIINLGLYTT